MYSKCIVKGGAKGMPGFETVFVRLVGEVERRARSHCDRYALPFSVRIMVWTGEYRGFAAVTFLQNGRFVIATQRAMRLRSVPDGKAIRRWVRALEETHQNSLFSAPYPNLGSLVLTFSRRTTVP